MSENRNNQILTIDTIYIVFFSMYYILPSVSAKFTFLFPLALVFVYIVIGTIRNGMKLSTIIVRYLFLIAFISFLYMILTDASSIAADVSDRGLKRFLSKYYQMAMMFFPLLFLKRIIDFSSFRVKKLVLIFSYALFAYVMYITIQELRINPNVTRAWAGFEENSPNNVANYHLSSVSNLFYRLSSCRLSLFFSAFQYLVLEVPPYKAHSNRKSLLRFRVTYTLHNGQILVG